MDPELQAILAEAKSALDRGADPQAVNQRIAQLTGGSVSNMLDLMRAAGPEPTAPAPRGRMPSNAPPATVGQLEDATATMMQGASLGFADEGSAAVRHPIAFVQHLLPGGRSGEAYTRERDSERAKARRFTEEKGPIRAGLLNMLGGALTGRALPAPGKGLLANAAVGAAESGVAAAGAAEGGFGERVKAGVRAAPVGAVLGPVLAKGIPAASGVVARAADIARVRPATAPRAPAGTQTRMSVGNGAGIRSVEERGNEMLVRALEADDKTPAGLLAALDETRGPTTLLDLAGDNTLGVARGAKTVQGSKAKNVIPETLADRVRGQEERIIGYALRDTGLGKRTNVLGTLDEIAEDMQKEADTLYGPIRGTVVDDPAALRALREPAFRKAYEKAAAIRQNEIAAAELDGLPVPEALPSLDDLLAGNGAPTLGVLDQVKRGLDDVIYSSKREGLGKAEIGSLEQVRHAFVRKLDAAVDAYKDARNAFAGKVALMESLEDGQRLFEMHPTEASQTLSRMGDSEKEMFRKGALEALMKRIESTNLNHDLTSRRPLADMTLDRQRLRMLFDNEKDFERFKNAIKEETRMAVVNRFVTGGSNTVDKLAELAHVAGVDLGDILSAAGGSPGGLLVKAANAMGKQAIQGFTRETADALTPKLTAGARGNQAELRKLIEDLIATQAAMQARTAGQAATARGLTATSGLLSQ